MSQTNSNSTCTNCHENTGKTDVDYYDKWELCYRGLYTLECCNKVVCYGCIDDQFIGANNTLGGMFGKPIYCPFNCEFIGSKPLYNIQFAPCAYCNESIKISDEILHDCKVCSMYIGDKRRIRDNHCIEEVSYRFNLKP